MLEWLAYVAVFVACLLRTTMPYWYKNAQATTPEEKLTFEYKYIATLITALITAFILTQLILIQITLPDVTVGNAIGFATVFASAWGLTDIYNTLLIDAWKKPS